MWHENEKSADEDVDDDVTIELVRKKFPLPFTTSNSNFLNVSKVSVKINQRYNCFLWNMQILAVVKAKQPVNNGNLLERIRE